MSSLSKIAADRAGARKSTGSPIAAANAIRQGLYSKRTIIIGQEESAGLAAMREDYAHEFRPTTSAELAQVEAMIACDWRIRRIWEIEPASIDYVMESQATELATQAPGIDLPTRTAFAYAELIDDSRLLETLHRLEVGYQRQWERAHRTLLRLRVQKLENEPAVHEVSLEPVKQPAPPAGTKPPKPFRPPATSLP
ncbi:MAG: hypothetical protein R2762_04960 [Bryobacteraceae bacterium]